MPYLKTHRALQSCWSIVVYRVDTFCTVMTYCSFLALHCYYRIYPLHMYVLPLCWQFPSDIPHKMNILNIKHWNQIIFSVQFLLWQKPSVGLCQVEDYKNCVLSYLITSRGPCAMYNSSSSLLHFSFCIILGGYWDILFSIVFCLFDDLILVFKLSASGSRMLEKPFILN